MSNRVEHPPPSSEAAQRKPNLPRTLLSEVRELVRLARELAVAMEADPADEALVENRVLRAADRIEALAAAHDSTDVGPRRDSEPEDEP